VAQPAALVYSLGSRSLHERVWQGQRWPAAAASR
jgi:hypothetical protein